MQSSVRLARILVTAARSSSRSLHQVPAFVGQQSAGLYGPAPTIPWRWATSMAAEDRNAEKMLDLISKSPKLQQMIMMALPSALRKPEIIQAMMSDPGMKEKLATMFASKGFKIPQQILDSMSAETMDTAFDSLGQLGVDPNAVFKALIGHPGLLQKLQENPQILHALMELKQNPGSHAKYDHDTLEVVNKIKEIVQSQQAEPTLTVSQVPDVPDKPPLQPPSGTDTVDSATSSPSYYEKEHPKSPSTPPAPAVPHEQTPDAPEAPSQQAPVKPPSSTDTVDSATSSSSYADTDAQAAPPPGSGAQASSSSSSYQAPAAPSNPMEAYMHILRSDPVMAQKLQNPRVAAALEEISKSPWKTLKYVFDREVQEVFKALKNVMKGKPPV